MGMFCGLVGRLARESTGRVKKEAMKRKKMDKVNYTEQPPGSRDKHTGRTPSTIKLRKIMGPSPPCRMLTPYEIELLRKSAQEVSEVVGQILAQKNNKE